MFSLSLYEDNLDLTSACPCSSESAIFNLTWTWVMGVDVGRGGGGLAMMQSIRRCYPSRSLRAPSSIEKLTLSTALKNSDHALLCNHLLSTPASPSRMSKWKWSCELGIMRNKVSFDTLRFWNRVHPGACASKVVGKRPSDWVICFGEEG